MSKIDVIDQKIVDLLMQDGRMPAAEIARLVGDISERAVRYRIDRLVRDGIIHISAITHPRAIGYSVVADVFIDVEPSFIQEVAKKLTLMDCVSYVACSIGETDISVQIVGHNNTEIYNFVTEVIGSLPGVHKTTTSIVPIVLKDVYQWHIPASIFINSTETS